jgi:betaine-aldehyde dehydrogenase
MTREGQSKMETRSYDLWIKGASVPASSGESLVRNSPGSGKAVAEFAMADASDVDRAVEAAKDAFEAGTWSEMPASERAGILLRLADLIEAEKERLGRYEAEEGGKILSAGVKEIEWCCVLLRYAASLAWQIPGKLWNHEGPGGFAMVSREAFPVVGMILPWNFPMVTLFQKLPYALAVGCSTVIKPSELTSSTTLEIARLAQQAGIPDGVINVVPGYGDVVGPTMCDHPDISMISFTGSTRVGRIIAERAGKSLKKVALEMGGKGANVIFADADLDAALEGAMTVFLINQGEECCAAGRLLIQQDIFDDFVDRLAEKARGLRLGVTEDADAQLGPMIHKEHFEKVLTYIDEAQSEGASIKAGGSAATGPGLENGHFIQPTILTDVTRDMQVFREEIFGPVICAIPFSDMEEAVALANDTDLGLANGVWTKDLSTAMKVSRRLRSGSVFVNSYLEVIPQMPFGGMKNSGLGRENGIEGLLEFTEIKSTFVKL